jgi:aminopeptidase YwaD
MKQSIFLYLTALIVQTAAYAQDTTYARMIIDSLSSPRFAGRGYVNHGLEKAADFLISEYTQIGLKSFSSSYEQMFSYGINTFPGRMELKLNNVSLRAGKDFIIDPVSPSCSGRFDVISVKVKDLLDLRFRNKLMKKMRGRFLVIDDRLHQELPAEETKNISEILNFFKYSPTVQSAGTILLTTDKLSWYPATMALSKPVFLINTDINLADIQTVDVSVEAKYISTFKSSNIIGYIKGTTVPDSFLVITAHYDHLGMMGKEVYFPGANDNASGVAMMLNLAKYFVSERLGYTLVFIALTGEEAGLLGAKYFTENPLFDLKRIKFLVNFDLAGTGNEGIKVVNGSVYPDTFSMLQHINTENHYLKSVQVRGEACNSDHCLFYKQGVPCFYIYTLGGSKAYHDIYDQSKNLPLTEFQGYMELMVDFFKSL